MEQKDSTVAREEISRRKRTHRSSSTSSSSSDDNRASRKEERRKERKRKHRDKEKRHSRKHRHHKKHRKHSRRDSDGEDSDSSCDDSRAKKRRKSERGEKHKRKKHHSSEKHRGGEAKDLSNEDYYSKNNEFATWLKEERGMFFSQFSSEEAHQLFQEFVNAWNHGKLRNEYYKGISSGPRTDHNWGIRKETSSVLEDSYEERELSKKLEKFERKKFRKLHEEVLDEFVPKATGRERLLEKRKINREQAKEREISPELMSEKDLLGGGDDFQRRLSREQARRKKKEMEKAAVLEEKIQASREKEAAAMSQIQAIINDAGGVITIPKRFT